MTNSLINWSLKDVVFNLLLLNLCLSRYEDHHKNMVSIRADPDTRILSLVKLITAFIVDLQRGMDYYNGVFERYK